MEENSKLPRVIKLANPLTDSTECTFFLVVNPGLETQARKEAEKYLHAKRLDVVNGGIQFDSTWGAVRRGQPKLRVASRVLVRVDQFGARDFQKLYRKVSNIPWEEWLKPKVGLLVRAASHTSRLRIKSGIEESVVEAFKKSFKMPPPRPTKELLCLVRVEDDICTISLDLSGDLLHKRGSHTDVGTAPLRETWAASIVDRVFELATTDEAIKPLFAVKWQWIEPMAGTAVFLREALALRSEQAKGLAKASKSAIAPVDGAGATPAVTDAREFAVDVCFKFKKEDEPAVAKKPVQDASEIVVSAAEVLAKLEQAVVIDQDQSQLERGRKALGESPGLVPVVYATVADVKADAKLKPSKIKSDLPRVVLVNPPWGQRLKGPDATDTPEGQTKLMAKIEADWQPALVAIVTPRIAGVAPRVPKGWVEHFPLEFRAGGIPVKARFFTVPSRATSGSRKD